MVNMKVKTELTLDFLQTRNLNGYSGEELLNLYCDFVLKLIARLRIVSGTGGPAMQRVSEELFKAKYLLVLIDDGDYQNQDYDYNM